METKHSEWMPSQYMDTDEWGILNQDNEIMVGISSRLTKERAELICRAVNDNARLREALQNAAKVFRDYEAIHRAKGTLECEAKALANRQLAEEMEAALAGKGAQS